MLMNYKKIENRILKDVNDFNVGDVFFIAEKTYSFIRIKRGNKTMLVKSMENLKEYSINILFKKKYIIGYYNNTKKTIGMIKMTNLKVNENVVIMTGKNNNIPQLYKLNSIKNKKSYFFKNPINGDIVKFNKKDDWNIFRLEDIIK